jgi:YVTN family beta-propeller protein
MIVFGAAVRRTFCVLAAVAAASCSRQPQGAVTVPLAPANIYSWTQAGDMSPAVAGALPRVYVPNVGSGDVYVIDPESMRVIDRFPALGNPQHVVPSWDLQTLWVTGSAKDQTGGGLTAIDPATGKAIERIPVEDAYNMYFTPDGASALVVAETKRRLEYRDPETMQLQGYLGTPQCDGLNHADFAADGSYAIFTCEFGGALIKIDVLHRKVLGFLKLAAGGMPQDIRAAPNGRLFYVANMMTDGVSLIDGDRFKDVGFVPTGVGAHGLYPSRDGTKLYVSNRGSHLINGPPRGPGSVSVIDFASRKVVANWPIPGGGSPDMGNVSADGGRLWLAGGAVASIPVGHTPHGLAVWPLPGRYSLGHTGVMR